MRYVPAKPLVADACALQIEWPDNGVTDGVQRVYWLVGVWADSNVRYEYRRELVERSWTQVTSVARFATGVFGQQCAACLKERRVWKRLVMSGKLDDWTQRVFRGKRCRTNVDSDTLAISSDESCHMRACHC